MAVSLFVVGAGASGISAAIWAKRLGLSPRLCEQRDRVGGQITDITLPIVDIPAMGEISADELRGLWTEEIEQRDIPLELNTRAIAFDPNRERLQFADGREEPCTHLIYSPGLRPRTLGVPGESAAERSGSVSDFLHRHREDLGDIRCLVVGGGDRALEAASRLAEAGARTTMVVRGSRFRGRPSMVRRLTQSGARAYFGTEVAAIEPETRHFRVRLSAPRGPWNWEGEGIFIRIGMEPDDRLNVVPVRARTPAFFVQRVGDAVAEAPYRSFVTAYASGMRAAKNVSQVE